MKFIFYKAAIVLIALQIFSGSIVKAQSFENKLNFSKNEKLFSGKFDIDKSQKNKNQINLSLKEKSESEIQDSGKFGSYTPNIGFKIVNTDMGDLNLKIYTYVRYVNQKRLEEKYVNYFGDTSNVKRRQDIQLNKLQISFLGWLLDKKLRYLAYVWSSGTAQGSSNAVVVAGNISYNFNKYIKLSGGVGALPGVRTTEGNYPFWLPTDNRQITDEFFRPSYALGVWADGNIYDNLRYQFMLANSMNAYGINASVVDNELNTIAASLVWLPTTGEFGINSSFGDFENHQKVALRLAGHYTSSYEDRQSQPTSDNFDNVIIRLSDGSVIFKKNLFGEGISIDTVRYQMTNFDAGVKYKGFSFDAGYYYRWLTNFVGENIDSLGFNQILDYGFQVMSSYMILQQRLQFYAGFSQVFGKYGNPWDVKTGLNFFPYKNRVLLCNIEYIQLYNSPVGALSLPYPVGGKGGIIYANFQLSF